MAPCIDDLKCLRRVPFPARSTTVSNQVFDFNLRIGMYSRDHRFLIFSPDDDMITQTNHH
ncbi:MAG TPA: hypothetical protein VGI19_11410 [Candidatus Cybelea sp.]